MAEKKTGVYGIRHVASQKIYVGGAGRSFERRWWEHRRALRDGKHHSEYLQRAWSKYGEVAFEFIILELCEPADCLTREQHWIDFHRAAEREFGYNSRKRATRGGISLGFKYSDEVRAKRSAAMKGRPGHKPSEETRAKLSAAKKGRPGHKPSEETRRKLKLANGERARLWGLARRGVPRSAESIAKQSAAQRGKKRSPETCAAMSARRKGVPCSAEARAKLKGRILTPEHRAKVSAGLKAYWLGRSPTAALLARLAASRKKRVYCKLSPEARAHLSAMNKGRVVTPEHRAKLSAATAAWHRRRKGVPEPDEPT